MNYTKFYGYIISIKKGFLLNFRIWGNGIEWMDTLLPRPNIIKRLGNNYLVSWLLEGFFLTENNQKFLNDAISRFILTFEKAGAYRVEWISWINLNKLTPNDVLHLEAYNLRDDIAPYLEPLKEKKDYRALELLASCTEYKESDDAFFDWLRFKIYDFVKENGKNALTLEYCKELAILGYEIMGHKKGISTPLAKAKSIYNWVMKNYNPKGNNWNYKRKTKDNKELLMTRQENILRINQLKAEKTKQKVYKAIQELKEKNEMIGIKKIAKITGVSVNTARKYINQAREEGLI